MTANGKRCFARPVLFSWLIIVVLNVFLIAPILRDLLIVRVKLSLFMFQSIGVFLPFLMRPKSLCIRVNPFA